MCVRVWGYVQRRTLTCRGQKRGLALQGLELQAVEGTTNFVGRRVMVLLTPELSLQPLTGDIFMGPQHMSI